MTGEWKWQGDDPDDGRERVAEGPRVHLGPERDRAGVLQPPQPLGHRGRGQPDPAAEFGDPHPGIRLELGDETQVDVVRRLNGVPGIFP